MSLETMSSTGSSGSRRGEDNEQQDRHASADTAQLSIQSPLLEGTFLDNETASSSSSSSSSQRGMEIDLPRIGDQAEDIHNRLLKQYQLLVKILMRLKAFVKERGKSGKLPHYHTVKTLFIKIAHRRLLENGYLTTLDLDFNTTSQCRAPTTPTQFHELLWYGGSERSTSDWHCPRRSHWYDRGGTGCPARED